jgi:NADP-dependent 3-hydroxy acid dehydrogenase YdfG
MAEGDRRVAWVTGAGSGIGRAAAIALAREGFATVVSGRRRDALEETAKLAGERTSVEVCDVTRADQVNATARRILDRHGRIDLLVANAGNNIKERTWRELDAARIDHVVDGNLRGAMYCIAAVLPAMRARKDGLIVTVSSMAGRVIGALSGPAYVAAKHGVTAMSHTVNIEECVNGIRCTAICPGEVDTPILANRPTPLPQKELDRMLRPEDVAEAVAWVARQPKHVCIGEMWITPTWNRGYVAQLPRDRRPE